MRWFALALVVSACSSQAPGRTVDGGGGGGGGGDGGQGSSGDAGHGSSGGDAGGGVPSTLTPGETTITVSAGGQTRTAELYVPSGATSTAPLMIALHGNGDTDTNFLATSGLEPIADAQGIVIVAPQGITQNLNVDGMQIDGVDWDAYDLPSMGQTNIDLPLLEALRTQIQATGQVDVNHTFVLGYSQGGYMAFLYGFAYSTVLSCTAVLAASSPFGGAAGDPAIALADGAGGRKIPSVLQIGTADSAYSAAQTTVSTLMSDGFPSQLDAINGAGHVPIPGNIGDTVNYCLGQTL